jgi:hypothetical protein
MELVSLHALSPSLSGIGRLSTGFYERFHADEIFVHLTLRICPEQRCHDVAKLSYPRVIGQMNVYSCAPVSVCSEADKTSMLDD